MWKPTIDSREVAVICFFKSVSILLQWRKIIFFSQEKENEE